MRGGRPGAGPRGGQAGIDTGSSASGTGASLVWNNPGGSSGFTGVNSWSAPALDPDPDTTIRWLFDFTRIAAAQLSIQLATCYAIHFASGMSHSMTAELRIGVNGIYPDPTANPGFGTWDFGVANTPGYDAGAALPYPVVKELSPIVITNPNATKVIQLAILPVREREGRTYATSRLYYPTLIISPVAT